MEIKIIHSQKKKYSHMYYTHEVKNCHNFTIDSKKRAHLSACSASPSEYCS